jgi:hypothetical protein
MISLNFFIYRTIHITVLVLYTKTRTRKITYSNIIKYALAWWNPPSNFLVKIEGKTEENREITFSAKRYWRPTFDVVKNTSGLSAQLYESVHRKSIRFRWRLWRATRAPMVKRSTRWLVTMLDVHPFACNIVYFFKTVLSKRPVRIFIEIFFVWQG